MRLIRGRSLLRRATVALVAAGMLGGALASSASASSDLERRQPPTSSTVTNEEAPAPLPRIAAGDDRRLKDTETGRPFIPRGYNYVRLAPQAANPEEPYHATFEPGLYDPERAEATLAQNSADGFNTVRVFLDPGHGQDNEAGSPHGLGHGAGDTSVGNAEYLDNVADFVRKAASHGIYVLPSMDAFPQNDFYRDIIVDSEQPVNISGRNLSFMYDGYIKAKEAYLTNFAIQMGDRLGPLMSTFLALELDNEAYFQSNDAPFNQMSGTVTVGDKTYDMAVPEQRQAAADDAALAYANRGAEAVKSVDPDLMVTMGAFTNLAVQKSGFDGLSTYCPSGPCNDKDYRYPVRVSTLTQKSDLDFLDIHTYPGPQTPLAESLDSMEWSEVEGVVVMGEFGAQREHFGNDLNQAATAMRTHQVDSCAFNITGWMFWTWDTDEDDIQQLFFRGNEGDGAINSALAPTSRPDPCLHEAPQVAPLVVESPAEGHVSDDPKVEFTGTGHAGGEVSLTVKDEVVGTAAVADDGTWSITPESGLPVGARFDAQLTQVVRLDYQDVVVSDLGVKAPAVTIDQPGDGATVDADQAFEGTSYSKADLDVTLEARADGDPDETAAAVEGELVRADDGGWTFTPSADLAAGDYTLTAAATAGDDSDAELLDSTATVSFVVEAASGDAGGSDESGDDEGDAGDAGGTGEGDANGAGEAGGDSGGTGDDLPDTGVGTSALVLAGLLLVSGLVALRARSLAGVR